MLIKRCAAFFFFNDTATTEIYTLSLHDALPICSVRMRMSARPTAACGLGIRLLALAPAPIGDLRGFTAESAKVQRDWETKFRAIPSPDSLREYMRHLSARPHHVGSPYDKDNADWILAKFKSFGLD